MNGEGISELLDGGTLLGQVFTPVRGDTALFLRNILPIYRGGLKRGVGKMRFAP